LTWRWQAAIGANVIAREKRQGAAQRNVLAKCFMAATSAARKSCLKNKKAGKRRMKQVGNVEIPQEAFLAILQVSDK